MVTPYGGGVGRALLIALIGALLLTFVSTRSTLWDRDEPRFARASVEMARSGNYLYPTFNGELRPDKPILIYWLQSSTIRLLGSNEFAVRVWSVLGAVVSALLTFFITRRMTSARVGHLAMIVLLSSPLMVVEGTAATVDAVLLAFVLLAGLLLQLSLGDGLRWWMVLPMGGALGAAQLTKGPVGLAVPLLATMGIWALGRREGLVAGRHVLWLTIASILGTVVFLAWAIPANRATDGEFARLGIGYHVVERMQRPFEGHGGGSALSYLLGLGTYPVVLVLSLVPWTLFLPAALVAVWRGRLDGRRGRAFVLGWSVPTFLLMSFVATKLPHYILPIYPILAIAIAHTIVRAAEQRLDPGEQLWLNRGVGLLLPVVLVTLTALLIGPKLLPAADLTRPGMLVAAIVIVGLFAAGRAWRARRMGRAVRWITATALAFQTSAAGLILPRLERAKPVPALARQVHQHLAALGLPGGDVEWVSLDFDEPTLLYYLDAPRMPRLATHELLVWAGRRAPGIAVMPRRSLDRLRADHEGLTLREIALAQGFNVGNSRWIELVAVERLAR